MKRLSRRHWLRLIGGGAVGVAGVPILMACGETEVATKEVPIETTVIKEVPVERVVIQEKIVTKEVEVPVATTVIKEVPVEKVVEKVIETERVIPALQPASGENVDVVTGFIPESFSEAPQWTALVQAGNLPPISERLPKEPLVYRPLRRIGKYGGTMRRAFTGPGDLANFDRILHDTFLYWNSQLTKVVPYIAKGWEVSDGGTTFTFFMREGHRWSDGTPLTADDVMFWYEDLYLNDDYHPGGSTWNADSQGEQGTWEKVDDYTVRVRFGAPNFVFVEQLASNPPGGAFSSSHLGNSIWAPKHYLSQFHPTYVGDDNAAKLASDAGYENWVQHMKTVAHPVRNPGCPVTTAWKPLTANSTPQVLLERNPYYHAVDIEGNQLPYIDRIRTDLAEDLEVLNLRAVAGELDFQVRHIVIGNVPVLKANEIRGGYTVSFYNGNHGTEGGFHFNQAWQGDDPEIKKWLETFDFRRALSHGIDRDELNEIHWVGLGSPGTTSPAPGSPYAPEPEYRTKYADFDPAKANAILDELGLAERDADGFRLRSDGEGTLILDLVSVAASFVDFPGIAESVGQMWERNLGIRVNFQVLERSLFNVRRANGELQIWIWSLHGNDTPLLYPGSSLMASAASAAPLYGIWYETGGARGLEPPAGSEIRRQQELHQRAKGVSVEEARELGKEIHRIMVDNLWVIGTVGLSPALIGVRVRSNRLENVAEVLPYGQAAYSPGPARPEQFFFKDAEPVELDFGG